MKTWCSRCRSDTHNEATCSLKDKGGKDRQDRAYKVKQGDDDANDDTVFKFRVRDGGTNIQMKGLMVEKEAISPSILD